MAEGARLESVYTGNRIVGSNPTPSARLLPEPILQLQPTPARSPYIGLSGTEPLDSDKPSASANVLSRLIFL